MHTSTGAGIGPTVDIDGAAGLLKVHPKTVLDMIGRGELPAARIGRAYVLLTKDVLHLIEREIVRQTAERISPRAFAKPRMRSCSQLR